jgi:L-cystine uptake protein TcyP (sodium:dicarboxylate symporter family)
MAAVTVVLALRSLSKKSLKFLLKKILVGYLTGVVFGYAFPS